MTLGLLATSSPTNGPDMGGTGVLVFAVVVLAGIAVVAAVIRSSRRD